MDYVLTENGNIKVTDGKPTVLSDGKEIAIDAIGANGRVAELVTQRDQLKTDLRNVTDKLTAFAGIDDPAAAIKAMQDIGSIGDTQQAELDTQREEINKAWEVKQTAWDKSDGDKSIALRKATIERDFATSEMVKGLTIPSDIAYTKFGPQFNDDGTANDLSGNPIYSLANPGKTAIGEEAISLVLNGYANIKKITKAGSSGGGAGGGANSGGAAQSITHEQFNGKTPKEKTAFVRAGGKVT